MEISQKKKGHMRQNHTLQKIRSKQTAAGLWLQTHHFHTARIIAAQGLFDWLLVDMEHTPVDLSTTSQIMAAIADVSAGSCTPLVRVAAGTMDQIKQALDAGAQGVVVPMIETAEDAARAVDYARYPPDGIRGGGGLTPQYGFGTPNHVEYLAKANQEIMLAVQVETGKAVENIESILAVEGIDMVFLGPFDLHISLGLPPSLWSDAPEFQEATHQVIRACQARDIPLGTLAPNAAAASARVQDGFTFIGIGTDLIHLTQALHAQVSAFKDAT